MSAVRKLISRHNGVCFCVRFPTKVIPDEEERETPWETERDGNRGEGGVKREEEDYDLCVFTTVYTESDSDSRSAAAVT